MGRLLGVLWLVGALACGSEVETVQAGGGAGGTPSSGARGGEGASTSAGGSGDGGAAGQAGTLEVGGAGGLAPVLYECGGHIYQCGDGVDNDIDGLIDSEDPECLGACDNGEESFALEIPDGMLRNCLLDCYFDPDGGQGNDDCHYSHRCDPNEVDPFYYPQPSEGIGCAYAGEAFEFQNGYTCAAAKLTQSLECNDICAPLTPNGCDCFGCCEVPGGTGNFVYLNSTGVDGSTVCSLADASNPQLCHPCEPVPACLNGCDSCELCLGKATPDDGCDEAGQCSAGVQRCGLDGQAQCPADEYCITGCCRPLHQ